MKKIIDSSTIKKGTIDHYLHLIDEDFDRIEVYSTAGDIRPPYPYQWIAYSKVFEGDDDPYEGIGRTPFEAVKKLYKNLLKH